MSRRRFPSDPPRSWSHSERVAAPDVQAADHKSRSAAPLVYRHTATGYIWTLVAQTNSKRLLRRADGAINWYSQKQITQHFVLVARPEHIECDCLSCRCPHRVENHSEVCRGCKNGIHVGRPNKQEQAR